MVAILSGELLQGEIRVVRLRRDVLRETLKSLLASLAGVEPSALVFASGPYGKPYLVRPQTDLRFNISHSGLEAVIAVTRGGEIGVDIEGIRDVRHPDAIAARCFSAEAQRAWQDSRKRREDFLELWTRHEALGKAMGTGCLRRSPRNNKDEEASWWVHPLDFEGLFGAVAGEETEPSRFRIVNVLRLDDIPQD